MRARLPEGSLAGKSASKAMHSKAKGFVLGVLRGVEFLGC